MQSAQSAHAQDNIFTFLDNTMVILELKVPRESETTPESAAQFFANITNLMKTSFMSRLMRKHMPTISLEIANFNQGIHFYIVCPKHIQSYIESQLKAQYPLITILPTTDYLAKIWTTPGGFEAGQLTLGAYAIYPLRTYKEFSDVDPLVAVMSMLSRSKLSDAMMIQYILGPLPAKFRHQGYRYIQSKKTADKVTGTNESEEMAAQQIKVKASEVGVKAGIRIFTHGETKERARELMQNLSGAFGGFSNAEGNYLKLTKPSSLTKKGFLLSIPLRVHKYVPKSQVFSVSEMATLWHLPNTKFGSVPTISWSRTYATESPENLPTALLPEKDDINFFARTDHKSEIITFGIKRKDRRRHVYIVGKSGTGKSTLIANMAINDIRNREGLAIIDPHGDLIETVLDYIPSYRVNDIVYLDPANIERSFVLNPLEVKNTSQRELVVSGIIAIFQKLYGHSWGPRLEHILRNTLFALTEIPDATFAQIPDFLTNPGFRNSKLDKVTDPVIKNFWVHEFGNLTPALQAEVTGPILNKVGQFLSAMTTRNIVGRPHSTIDLEHIMNSGKILLLNLSQGRMGEDASSLLGAMIITKMQLAAMNRVNLPEEDRKDFFMYVDEFQNFATKSFAKILSEARKYRLSLILANQYTAQLDPDLLEAIYGNCGTLISFLVGSADAARLSKEFDQVYKDSDFTSLANYQILTKLMIDSMASRPFAATTLPLPRARTQNREKAIRVSHQKYTKPLKA